MSLGLKTKTEAEGGSNHDTDERARPHVRGTERQQDNLL